MLDVAYGFRVLFLYWKLRKAQVKNIFSPSVLFGRCWPNDLDMNFHMNNSRYLRECDFGRIKFLIETGLWNSIFARKKKTKNCNVVVSSLQAQFRQSVELGDRFKIITHLDGWDENAFYMHQSMVLEKNDQIAFSLLIRLSTIPRSITPQMLIDDLQQIGSIQSPTLSTTMQNFKQNHRIDSSRVKSKI